MTKNTEPFWYKLIQYHLEDAESGISEGLTIPYIIGAKKLMNLGDDTVNSLLEEIISSEKTEKVAVLSKCGDLNNYVIELRERKNIEDAISFSIQPFCNSEGVEMLYVKTSASDNLGDSLDKISSNLSDSYTDALNKERYSRKVNNWETFNDVEISRIRKYFS